MVEFAFVPGRVSMRSVLGGVEQTRFVGPRELLPEGKIRLDAGENAAVADYRLVRSYLRLTTPDGGGDFTMTRVR